MKLYIDKIKKNREKKKLFKKKDFEIIMDALSACVYFLIEYELKIIISTTLILIQNWEILDIF